MCPNVAFTFRKSEGDLITVYLLSGTVQKEDISGFM